MRMGRKCFVGVDLDGLEKAWVGWELGCIEWDGLGLDRLGWYGMCLGRIGWIWLDGFICDVLEWVSIGW